MFLLPQLPDGLGHVPAFCLLTFFGATLSFFQDGEHRLPGRRLMGVERLGRHIGIGVRTQKIVE